MKYLLNVGKRRFELCSINPLLYDAQRDQTSDAVSLDCFVIETTLAAVNTQVILNHALYVTMYSFKPHAIY